MIRIMITQKGNQIMINIKGKWMAKKDSKFKKKLEIRNYKITTITITTIGIIIIVTIFG